MNLNLDCELFMSETGEELSTEFVNEIYKITSKAIQITDKLTTTDEEDDESVAHVMLKRFNKLIDLKYNTNDEYMRLKPLIEGIFMWRCKCENIENSSKSMTHLSSKNYNTWKELKGSQIMELRHGYKNIIELMISSYKKQFHQKLHLSHALTKIIICTQQTNCKHCLYTKETNLLVLIMRDLASNRDLIVLCENIVCTMSLGYLKENLSRLIEPSSLIPIEKLKAVASLGYGTVNKIFLIYEKPFWKFNGFHPIWLLNEHETVLNKLEDINEVNWYENISYFETVKDHRNILCAWISGCEFFESFSDDKIAQDCTMVLRKFIDKNIPLPKQILK